MGKQKRPRAKAQAAKTEANKSTSAATMDVDDAEVGVNDTESKGVSFKSTKAKLDNQLSKVDKRALRQRILMQKLLVGGNGAKAGNSKTKDSISNIQEEEEIPEPVSSDALLKRLEKRKKSKQNPKTKDKPIKKASQRKKQYIHNVLKITTQVNKKASKQMTQGDITERVKNLVAKLQQTVN